MDGRVSKQPLTSAHRQVLMTNTTKKANSSSRPDRWTVQALMSAGAPAQANTADQPAQGQKRDEHKARQQLPMWA